jgi:hypothetical protein
MLNKNEIKDKPICENFSEYNGVEKFKSKLNEDVSYEFTIPGIYAYWCAPHKSLGMIGFVIVGDDKSNLDLIKKIRFFGKSKKISKILIDQIK